MWYIFGFLFMMAFSMIIFLVLSSKKLQKNVERLEKEQKELENHLIMMKENKEMLLKVQREYKKQERNLEKLLCQDGDKIFPSNSGGGTVPFDPILNAILLDADEKCTLKNIDFKFRCGEFQLPFSKIETVSLFENMLDNAIEACMLLETDRFIFLNIYQEQDILYILCKNSKTEKNQPLLNDFQTTKADEKNHGNGVAVIQNIVDKYNGHLNFQDKGKCLILEIRL